MPIDTLKAARRLQEEDTFDEDQAERIAEVLSELDVASATKEDLSELEERLTDRIDRLDGKVATKVELESLRSETQAGIESVREEMQMGLEPVREETQTGLESVRNEIKAGLESVRNELGKKIEEKHSATVQIVVTAVGVLAAVVALSATLAIYFLG